MPKLRQNILKISFFEKKALKVSLAKKFFTCFFLVADSPRLFFFLWIWPPWSSCLLLLPWGFEFCFLFFLLLFHCIIKKRHWLQKITFLYKKHEICFCLLLLFFSRGLKFPRSHLTVVFFFFDVLRLERTLVFSRCFFNFGAQNYCFYPLQEVPGGPQGKILNCFFFFIFYLTYFPCPKNKSKNKV